MLDLGAGNGIVGERLRERGVAAMCSVSTSFPRQARPRNVTVPRLYEDLSSRGFVRT